MEIESLDPFKPRTSLVRSPTRSQSLDESTPALRQVGKENLPSASGSQKRPLGSPEETRSQKRQDMSEEPISEDLDFYRTVSEIYNIISKEKSLRKGVKDHIHETLGRLNSMYSEIEKENCVLKTEARMNKDRQTPIVHTQTYAQTMARTAAQRQQPVLPKQDKHTLFVTAEGKDA